MDIRNLSIDVIQDTERIPYWEEIRGVAIDDVVGGNVRRDVGRWVATGTAQRGQVADCATFDGAVVALACEARRS